MSFLWSAITTAAEIAVRTAPALFDAIRQSVNDDRDAAAEDPNVFDVGGVLFHTRTDVAEGEAEIVALNAGKEMKILNFANVNEDGLVDVAKVFLPQLQPTEIADVLAANPTANVTVSTPEAPTLARVLPDSRWISNSARLAKSLFPVGEGLVLSWQRNANGGIQFKLTIGAGILAVGFITLVFRDRIGQMFSVNRNLEDSPSIAGPAEVEKVFDVDMGAVYAETLTDLNVNVEVDAESFDRMARRSLGRRLDALPESLETYLASRRAA